MKNKLLIVDDEESIRKLLAARFDREGWEVICAENGKEGVKAALDSKPDVIITDVKMPGMDGFQMIEALRTAQVLSPIVVITGHGEKECAIESLHKGAFDYLEKPFDMNEISHTIKRALQHEQLRTQNIALMKKLETDLEVKSTLLEKSERDHVAEEILVGKSSHIQNLKETIRTISDSFGGDHEPVVLITGESGVGKEVVARFIHASIHPKDYKTKPFVAINCAAFPENLLESELFGYEKGAFTGAQSRKLGLFELANGGTLFLDEIGDMDLKMQAKLLRVLQERVIRRVGGTVDVSVRPHIVAATNKDLAKAVQDKEFREDLYYRLNTIPLAIAPLRSRPEDVEVLATYFLKKLTVGKGKRFSGMSASALKSLQAYAWPGNVRELKSVIERAIILEKGPTIELTHLRQENMQVVRSAAFIQPDGEAKVVSFPKSPTNQVHEEVMEKGLTLYRKEVEDNFVKQILVEFLTNEQGNVSSIARKLKLDRANLLRLLKRFTLEPDTFRIRKAA